MENISDYFITHPKADFNQSGVAYSQEFNQCYHSTLGAIKESEYVFLDGIKINDLFKKKQNFTIAEIGFGTGLNFILSMKAFEESSSKPKIFNYLAFEKYPLSKKQLISFYKNFDFLNKYSQTLIEQLKYLSPGFNRITFGKNKPILTLMIGDALTEITKVKANVDAWYFDGFSPKANPDLWSDKLIRNCKRISNSNTVFASFSCARYFKENLLNNSCSFRKIPGFENKREMLVGEIPNENVSANILKSEEIAIIGSGLAGSFLANSLSQRGIKCTIYEADQNITNGASGNPIGIFRPDFSLTPDSRHLFYFRNYIGMLRWLFKNKNNWEKFDCNLNGIDRFLHTKSLSKLYNDFPNEMSKFPFLERNSNNSFFYPLSGILSPKKLCDYFIKNNDLITVKTNASLKKITKKDELFDLQFNTFNSETKKLILANAHGATLLIKDLDLSYNKGQLAYLNKEVNKTYCYGGYIAKTSSGSVLGGSYEHNSDNLEINNEQNEYMLKKLKQYLPELEISNENIIGGRAAFRTYTQDKLPLVKQYEDNLFLNLAHGSKGITTCFYAAEQIVSLICGEPSEVN